MSLEFHPSDSLITTGCNKYLATSLMRIDVNIAFHVKAFSLNDISVVNFNLSGNLLGIACVSIFQNSMFCMYMYLD